MVFIGGMLALGFLLVFVSFLVVGIGSGNIDRDESILMALVLFGATASMTFRSLSRIRRPIVDGHQS
jgi:hypothetical protein